MKKIQIDCLGCGAINDIDEEVCWKCKRVIEPAERQASRERAERRQAKEKEFAEMSLDEQALRRVREARASGNWGELDEGHLDTVAARIRLIHMQQPISGVVRRDLGPVQVSIVYGSNLFRDFAVNMTDIVGGRSKAWESLIAGAYDEVLKELRRTAVKQGATAVANLRVSYQELIGGGKTGMLMAVASGQALVVSSGRDK